MAVQQLPADQVAIRIRDDLDFLAQVLTPDVAESPYPDFYKKVWVLILQNLHTLELHTVFRFLLGLPRGHVKTTFLKLIVCYLLIHDYEIDFIQVVCATEPLSRNFLADVNTMMQSPIITQVYGSWNNSLTRDTREVKQSNWQGRTITLAAIGAGTATRGLNIDNLRPQLIICDDAQTKNNDNSQTERDALLEWLTGTLFKSLTKTKKRAIFYIGNMYSEDCILYTLSKMPHWISLITGGILADGTALWPEIQTVPEMLEEYGHDNALGLGSIWFAEVQNDPIGASAGLLDLGEVVPQCPTEDHEYLDLYPTRFITIDPAGLKATSDDNVVAGHCMMEEGKVGTFALKNGKWSPTKVIDEALMMAIEYRIGIIFVESNAYQGTLAFWMEEAIERHELGIRVLGIPTGTASKFRRIKAWVKQLVTGKWEIMSKSAYNKITYQLYAYKTNRTDNTDDLLDVEAQAVLAVNRYGREIQQATNTLLPPSELEIARPVRDNSRVGLVLRSLS